MTVKIVVDTNIFVSAIISKSGASRRVIRGCLEGKYLPLMGNSLFAEYESLINRDEIIKKSPLTSAEIEVLLASFMSVCRWISIYYLWRPNLKDEADNHLIELALAGNAQFIITNNIKDFRGAELSFPHLQILQPEYFLEV